MAKNGLYLVTPTSISYTGTSASISAQGSVSFSAVSSLTLNNVFSSEYDNYQIVQWVTGAVGTAMKLSSSGTIQSSSYQTQYVQYSGTTVSSNRSSFGYHLTNASASSTPGGSLTEIFGPYLNRNTSFKSVNISGNNDGTCRILDAATLHSVTGSYDGLVLQPTSGSSLSGRIAVYGMRK